MNERESEGTFLSYPSSPAGILLQMSTHLHLYPVGSHGQTTGLRSAWVVKGRYRLSNVFYGTAAAAATNMMFQSLRKNACGTNCHRGWAKPAFCSKECLCVRPETQQFLVRSAAIQLCLRTYS